MDERSSKLKSQRMKKKCNIQVSAMQSGEIQNGKAIGTKSITVSTKRSSRDFEINDMKNPRKAKMFYKCVKMEKNKNNNEANTKMKIIDTLENKIQKLEVEMSKVLARKRLDANILPTASEVELKKPKRTCYNRKRKVAKRNKTKSATGMHETIPHIKSEEFEFAAEHTASSMEEEYNRCIISSKLNAKKHSVKKRRAKSTVSRSTWEVQTENTNSLEDEKPSFSLPNELAIKITEVWSLDKETESDDPVSLEQSNDSLKTENAAMFSKNFKMFKHRHSNRVIASETKYDAVEVVLRKWTNSEKRVVTKSKTKNRLCKSLDQVNSNFKKKKKKLPTVYGIEQLYNYVPPTIYTGYPAYLNTSPNIQLGYPSYLNFGSNIQIGNPVCANMLQVCYPAYQNTLPIVQLGYPAYQNTLPTVQLGYPAYLNSHLHSFAGIPASNLLSIC